jgi:hypothetical protein
MGLFPEKIKRRPNCILYSVNEGQYSVVLAKECGLGKQKKVKGQRGTKGA